MNNQAEQVKIHKAIAKFFGVPMYNNVLDPINVTVDTILDELGRLGIMLCGGSITSVFTNQTINDLDFYCKSKDGLKAAQEFLYKMFPVDIYSSSNAVTMKRTNNGGSGAGSRRVYTIQLITRFHGSPQEVMDCFDFTITQGVYDFSSKEFIVGDRFFQDLSRRKLVYLGKSHFPICAMYRTKKYQAKGYTTPGSTIMHIALAIVRLEIKNYKDLKEQLMGIDTMYLQGLLAGADYADALPVDYGQFLSDAFTRIEGFQHEDEESGDEVTL